MTRHYVFCDEDEPEGQSMRESCREELAAIGFRAACRLICLHMRIRGEKRQLDYIAERLGRAAEQVQHYRLVGCPPYIAVRVLDLMQILNIPFGRHQLIPTRELIDTQMNYALGVKKQGARRQWKH